jgi:dihydrodipicolinate synthase/N-acetylneuraminate lyase
MYGIGGLKATLEMIGYVGGTVRAPLRLPDEAGKQEIARLLKDAEMILAQQEKSLRRDPHNSLAIPLPNFR